MLLCLLRYDSISQRGFVMNKHQPIRLRIIVLVSFKDFVVSEAMNRECGRVVQRGYKYVYDRISLFQGSQNLHTHTHTIVPNALTTLHSHVSPPGYSTHHVQHQHIIMDLAGHIYGHTRDIMKAVRAKPRATQTQRIKDERNKIFNYFHIIKLKPNERN